MSQNLNLDTILTVTEELINSKLEEMEALEKALARVIERDGSLVTIKRTQAKIDAIKKMLEPIQPLLENYGNV